MPFMPRHTFLILFIHGMNVIVKILKSTDERRYFMMRKSRLLLILLLNAMLIFIMGCTDKHNSNTNALGGKGKLMNVKSNIIEKALYDDENIYFYTSSSSQPTDICIKFTKSNRLLINCNNAACLHNTKECGAAADYKLFEFNNKIYKYIGSKIETIDDKVVFKNSVPDNLEDEDATDVIEWVKKTDDDKYAVVGGYGFSCLINDKFEIVYTITDLTGGLWTKIYKDKFYYVNEVNGLVEVNIASGSSRDISNVEMVSTITDDGEYIFYFDKKYRLHKYSLETNTDIIIKEHMTSPFFMVYDGYIYYEDSAWPGSHKEILDYNGNLIKDCTECKNMSMDSGFKVNNKIYSDFIDDSGRLCLAVMNEDGTDYNEYQLEN